MDKSPDAFRTISEVADWLGTPTHVLRFWESRFTQIKPVKRAGGRRYYRPNDMALLGGIKKLLHEDGLTIRGVQKILREQGIKHVASLSQPVDEEAMESGEQPVEIQAPAPAVEPDAFVSAVDEAALAPEATPAPVTALAEDGPDPAPRNTAPSDDMQNLFAEEPDDEDPHLSGPPETPAPDTAPPVAESGFDSWDAAPDDPDAAVGTGHSRPIFSAPSAAQDSAAGESPAFRRDFGGAPGVALPVQPYDVEHGETHVADSPSAVASAPPVTEAAPIPPGPSLSEQVLEQLRAGATIPPAALKPVYDRLVALRGRMASGPDA